MDAVRLTDEAAEVIAGGVGGYAAECVAVDGGDAVVGPRKPAQTRGRTGANAEKRGRGGEQRVRLRKQRRPQERQQPAEQKQQRQRQDQRGKATLKVKFPPQIQNDRFQQRRDEQREQKRQTPRQHIAKADIKERCTHEKRER